MFLFKFLLFYSTVSTVNIICGFPCDAFHALTFCVMIPFILESRIVFLVLLLSVLIFQMFGPTYPLSNNYIYIILANEPISKQKSLQIMLIYFRKFEKKYIYHETLKKFEKTEHFTYTHELNKQN